MECHRHGVPLLSGACLCRGDAMRRPGCKGRQQNDFSTRSAGTFRVRRFPQMPAGRDQQANGTVPMDAPARHTGRVGACLCRGDACCLVSRHSLHFSWTQFRVQGRARRMEPCPWNATGTAYRSCRGRVFVGATSCVARFVKATNRTIFRPVAQGLSGSADIPANARRLRTTNIGHAECQPLHHRGRGPCRSR